jgi:diadenosine tetraphosphate (Ap4A) HIT family hydrolase
MADFVLDPRLEADSVPVAELALSTLRLMNDARFPWLLLVPQRPGMVEIIDLKDMDRALLFDEIIIASNALKAVTDCGKLNVASLGNQVRQLHVHVVARFEGDAAWRRPVWGVGEPVAYRPATRDRLAAAIRAALPSR